LPQPDPARTGPKPFQTGQDRLDKSPSDTQPGTPYREAVLAVRRRLEAARRGDIAPAVIPPAAVPQPPAPGIGRPAPDFAAGGFRLSEHRGSPVVLVFFKPGSETADLAMAVANAL